MRKSLIALASLSALTGVAHAQTSVTLYGVVDAGVEYINRVATAPAALSPTATGPSVGVAPVGSRFGMPNQGGLSASRWGLRGVEDLGGGLKAYFTLESQFLADSGGTNGTPVFTRQSFIGLGNQYGKLTFGKQYSSLLDAIVNFAPTRFSPAFEPGIWWVGVDYKPNNAVKYAGQFGNLAVSAYYSFGAGLPASALAISTAGLVNGGNGETPGNPRDNTSWGGAVTYLGPTFGGSIGYDQWNPSAAIGVTAKVRKAAINGSYSNGPLKLMAGYRWGDQTYANGNTIMRDDFWFAGVTYKAMPALDLQLGYYYSNIKKMDFGNTGRPSNPANPQQVSLVADYALSKRTDVYLSTAWAHNGSLGNDGAFTLFLFNYAQAPGQKNMVGVATGIRHVF
ncbi:porin [Cupriavidus necator]|uniref:porin n=1 Tax=Cupriavidus necator TaxID=106590 RepID=UPI003ECD5E6F